MSMEAFLSGKQALVTFAEVRKCPLMFSFRIQCFMRHVSQLRNLQNTRLHNVESEKANFFPPLSFCDISPIINLHPLFSLTGQDFIAVIFQGQEITYLPIIYLQTNKGQRERERQMGTHKQWAKIHGSSCNFPLSLKLQQYS